MKVDFNDDTIITGKNIMRILAVACLIISVVLIYQKVKLRADNEELIYLSVIASLICNYLKNE